VGGERRDVTDYSGGKGAVRERCDVTDSAWGKWVVQ
jgi:3-deoxy-D-manno-octulosonate 8-phosphate phosphatase KdsC-like HAD superfamily phosphatase